MLIFHKMLLNKGRRRKRSTSRCHRIYKILLLLYRTDQLLNLFQILFVWWTETYSFWEKTRNRQVDLLCKKWIWSFKWCHRLNLFQPLPILWMYLHYLYISFVSYNFFVLLWSWIQQYCNVRTWYKTIFFPWQSPHAKFHCPAFSGTQTENGWLKRDYAYVF